jgi:hypothetical protein
MGSPTVTAKLTVSGSNSQVDARLWDVAPGGSSQTLVARSVYRPDPSGVQTFQLHPNGWHFAAGHVAKLELLGQDPPYARPSNGTFQISVQDLDLRLAVAEQPGSVPDVGEPTLPVLPAGQRLAPSVVGLGVKVSYRGAKKRRAKAAVACRWSRATARVTGIGLDQVKAVQFMVGKRTIARDRTAPFGASIGSAKLRRQRNHSRALRVRARMKDGSLRTLSRKLRACR